MIKHISFDLWLTLIKSHPEFKKQRAHFFQKEFNSSGFMLNEVMDIIQETDLVTDRLNEKNGKKVPTELMYKRILLKLGMKSESINNELLVEIKEICNKLFMNYQPELLNSSIYSMLNVLFFTGFSLNISSNTGFIEGRIVNDTLKNLGIFDYFVFRIYSDEINASKPSHLFFSQVYSQITYQKSEVLHIGDNYKSDYDGALKFGFNALHIKNHNYTFNDIAKHL